MICPVVYAELAAGFDDRQALGQFIQDLGIQVEALSAGALWRAAEAWHAYARRHGQRVQCPQCGRQFNPPCPSCHAPIAWRQHLIPDFLIGGHAIAESALLITRDPGYYRTYFPELQLVVPTAPAPSR